MDAAIIFMVAISNGAGWTIIEACRPLNAPRSSIRIFPLALPTSSAGVPSTVIVTPSSSATLAAAIPAPTDIAAIRLCPHAWPMPGRQSYSAQMPMCSGPLPARAMNAVGIPATPFSTRNPAASNVSDSHADAFSSSKPNSGFEWMRWLRLTRVDRAASSRSRAPDFAVCIEAIKPLL